MGEAQRLQVELEVAEQATERLAADNERSRKLLHAVRFETDAERFVPAWARKTSCGTEIDKRIGGMPSTTSSSSFSEGCAKCERPSLGVDCLRNTLQEVGVVVG